jgi:hypothetical protein
MSQCKQTSAVCRSLVLLALGWAGWSGNASRRCTEILAMVTSTENAPIKANKEYMSSNKNTVNKLLI